MKTVIYIQNGGPEVLRVVDREIPDVGSGEVRVRIAVSGVNPTDWRSRSGQSARMRFPEQIPHQDGAGWVDAIGNDVDDLTVGQRVWVWDAAHGRAVGTAAEYVVLPRRQVVALADSATFEVGASLGIPALTAHRLLTVSEGGPSRLSPGALEGVNILIHGGAGAVGHAAIQMARWAGATVVTTVSGPDKAELARAAGADHVLDYRRQDVAKEVLAVVPEGVDTVVELDLAANLATDTEVLAACGSVNVYATGNGELLPIPNLGLLIKNVGIRFVYTYTTRAEHKDAAVADVSAAVDDGAMNVGTQFGLPISRFTLDQTAEAHASVESGTVGKVLITVAD